MPARHGARPLSLLIVSNTAALPFVQGGDRDWVNLLNALGPERCRATWVGVDGTAALKSELDARVLVRTIDIDHPCFYELTPDNARERRSPWLWSKIAVSTAARLSRSAVRLRAALRGSDFDVVISNTSVVLLGAVYARLTRRPHVWTVKEHLDLRIRACRRFAALITRLSAAVIVPSRIIAEPFRSRVHVLPDGADLPHLRASATASRAEVLQSLGLPASLPMVAQIGAICERKGQHLTAEAFARLSARHAQPVCSLVFFGTGKPADLDRVQRALAAAPASWRGLVRVTSFAHSDLSALAAADLVVHPSIFQDALPNAVREAMILGKPVIGAAIGGIPDMLIDGQSGVLIPAGDAEALSTAIAGLIEDPARRRRLGDQAATLAARRFDIHQHKLAYHQLLDQVSRQRVRS